jgi:hypothetical protein
MNIHKINKIIIKIYYILYKIKFCRAFPIKYYFIITINLHYNLCTKPFYNFIRIFRKYMKNYIKKICSALFYKIFYYIKSKFNIFIL